MRPLIATTRSGSGRPGPATTPGKHERRRALVRREILEQLGLLESDVGRRLRCRCRDRPRGTRRGRRWGRRPPVPASRRRGGTARPAGQRCRARWRRRTTPATRQWRALPSTSEWPSKFQSTSPSSRSTTVGRMSMRRCRFVVDLTALLPRRLDEQRHPVDLLAVGLGRCIRPMSGGVRFVPWSDVTTSSVSSHDSSERRWSSNSPISTSAAPTCMLCNWKSSRAANLLAPGPWSAGGENELLTPDGDSVHGRCGRATWTKCSAGSAVIASICSREHPGLPERALLLRSELAPLLVRPRHQRLPRSSASLPDPVSSSWPNEPHDSSIDGRPSRQLGGRARWP